MTLPFYGRISSLGLDPIEKKPLYHYHPGAAILSVGFVGCSLHCPFCQNHRISQGTDAPTEELSPASLVATARREGSFGIAYTYSEPLIHLEYVLDCARAAREAGLKNVLVTNGYIEPGPLEEALPLIDAANVDLKSRQDVFYRKELGGALDPVLSFIRAAAGRMALEVTTLVIPGRNDTSEEIEEAAAFLADLDPEIPYHLSAYTPRYRYTAPPTPPGARVELAAVARRRLRHVYVGNVAGAGAEGTDTRCPDCRAVWITRRGYATAVVGLRGSKCAGCGRESAIRGRPV